MRNLDLKTSEVFRHVLGLIENGRQSHICHAIAEVHGFFDTEYDENYNAKLHKTKAGLVIRTRMGVTRAKDFCCSLGTWVMENYPEIHKRSYLRGRTDRDGYEARVAWLNALIAEFEAKGD